MKADAKGQKEDARRLREFASFENFSDENLQHLVRAAVRTSTSGPWPLIHEGTPAHACYILLSGDAGVYVGKDRIAVVGPGEVIGESVLKRGKLRNATVTTTGQLWCCVSGAMISPAWSTRYPRCVKPWTRLWRDTCRRQQPIRVRRSSFCRRPKGRAEP